jgi:hypothetical protein
LWTMKFHQSFPASTPPHLVDNPGYRGAFKDPWLKTFMNRWEPELYIKTKEGDDMRVYPTK